MQVLPVVLINESADKFTAAVAEKYPMSKAELTLHIEWLRAKKIGWKINSVRLVKAHIYLALQFLIVGYASLAAEFLSENLDQ